MTGKLLLLCFFFYGLEAAAQETVPLYAGVVPHAVPCNRQEVKGRTAGGRTFISGVTKPSLTIFMPAGKGEGRTAVIVCPGGGYSILTIGDGGFEAAKELAKNDIVAIVLKYRTATDACNTGYPMVPLEDVQQAIAYTRKHAAQWHIDPHKVGLMGLSAGGHLAAMAATHFADPQIDTRGVSVKPDFTILGYPVISFTDSLTSRHSRTRLNLVGNYPTDKQKIYFSAEKQVTVATPPAFIIAASDDSTVMVENSIAYYEALHRFKIPVQLMLYQKGGHGFALYNKAEKDAWLPAAIKWMRLNDFLK